MECLIPLCCQKCLALLWATLFLQKTRIGFGGVFFLSLFFLALFGDFVDRFFILQVSWVTSGERMSGWEHLTKPNSVTATAAWVKGQVALHRMKAHGRQLARALPVNPRLKAP